MPDWLTSVGLAVAVSGLASALFSFVSSWLRWRRSLRVKIGEVEVDLSARDVNASIERLEAAAGEIKQHPRVFLSYAGADREFAKRLVADLERQGIRVWFPDREIAVGDSLPKRIGDAMNSSQWVAVILSPDALNSKWLQTELKLALREESRRDRPLILPVLHRGEGPPAALSDRVYADFRENYAIGLESLLRAIRR